LQKQAMLVRREFLCRPLYFCAGANICATPATPLRQ
jgi:hypothetical protein